ncbi:type II secretion system F family protein [Amycolatopsis sp. H20-H5]|uniref:type II secretion system F family protein n=1 Tax=Amycolatopsis sp. H20-H5 TaxID=3046309 RepID=UPI002DB86601|nr:type II secretion system F family protein [Amycolatopsis sp. H20-H5]MEC3979538.1 type II secretion system F family protein [Amycolatopsis sp. H20-H5]
MSAVAITLMAAALLSWPAGRRLVPMSPATRPVPVWLRSRAAIPAWVGLLTGAGVFAGLGGGSGVGWGVVTGLGAGWGAPRTLRRAARRAGAVDFLRSAAVLDLFAACLRGGLPVPVALEAVAQGAPPGTAAAFRSTAALLALGADPAEAWAPVRECPGTGELAVAAVRTARAGTALATFSADLAQRLRGLLTAEAEERAERAAVVLAAPIGLCFLPAFFCLGVLPVVIGLAQRLGEFI